MVYLEIILKSALLLYVLWIFYLAVMNLKRAWAAGNLNRTARILAAPVVVVGFALDIVSNIFPMSILFLEPPEELTVTARLSRHIRDSTGWELALAQWFIPILDPFDHTGHHITEKPNEE